MSVRFVFYPSLVCYRATGLIELPLRLRMCLGFWVPLACCSSPHPRSAFHFRFSRTKLANPRARAGLGPAFPSEIPRPTGRHLFDHAPACRGAWGHPCFARLRVVCISHFTSDFLPPCTQIQIRVYSTAFPVLPTCCIFPSFSNAERYRVAVASETCRSFSTSSFVIFSFVARASKILSSFFRFRS